MKTKAIKQTVTFPGAKPKEVYNLIMDEKKHSAFTGSKVSMSDDEVDGKFEMFDGYCSGFNIELKKGKKIVQGWHFAEEGWPEDFDDNQEAPGLFMQPSMSAIDEPKINRQSSFTIISDSEIEPR